MNRLEVVKLLLSDSRTTTIPYKAISTASRDELIEVLRLLLSDPRMRATSLDKTVRTAYMCGYDEITKLLLEDPRTNQQLFYQHLVRLTQRREWMTEDRARRQALREV